jgi:glutaredoxin
MESCMKFFVRLFFKTLRILLGPLMLLWEWLTRPKGIVRPPALQAVIDQKCQNLVLYQYRTCPFCIKVRQEIRRLSLNIARRDAQADGANRDELVRGGGKAKVPCLKITDPAGNSQWLYESGAIMAYLRDSVAIAG